MAAEAIRQTTRIEEAVEFRNIAVRTALVLNESSPREIVTTFHRLRLTVSLDSEWWEFSISSHNGHTWIKHSSGEIRTRNETVAMRNRAGEQENLPRKASSKLLEDITTTTTGARIARARAATIGMETSNSAILDSYFPLLSIAARYGLTYDYHQVIPASVGSLILRRCSVNNLLVSAIAVPTGSGGCGTGTVSAGGETIIELSKVRLTSFTNGGKEEHAPITARSEWVPHFETAALGTLVKPARVDQDHAARLDELITEVSTSAHIVKAITLVTDNASAMLSGRKKAFEVLFTENALGKFLRFLNELDGSAFFNRLGHQKPNLRVLELGAGIGSATAGIVENLTRPDGQVLFSQYAVSDPSPGMIEALKARFQGFPNMSFDAFDIGTQAESQGFDERDFDLIIAAGVLHSTPKLSESLTRVRQLLAPSGRILLQSLQPGLSWSKYVLGLLPNWENGVDDGRSTEPYVDLETWQTKLATAGLEITGELAFDSDGPRHINHVIVGRPRGDHLPARKAAVLSESSTGSYKSHPVIDELLARGYELSYCSLADILPPGQDIIAFLDGQASFLEQLDATKLEQLRAFINNIANSGILRVTQPSRCQCADPSFAQIHGLARCIRSELGIALQLVRQMTWRAREGVKLLPAYFKVSPKELMTERLCPTSNTLLRMG
ncbi:hypothetical protein BDW66DRAFT_154127 [Aspergillus desertorum]